MLARVGARPAVHPPAITHPEFFYGFVGVALAWQVMFLVIGSSPVRLRPAMLPAVLEKASFAVAAAALYAADRVPATVLAFGAIDGAWGVLFFLAWVKTRENGRAAGPAAPAAPVPRGRTLTLTLSRSTGRGRGRNARQSPGCALRRTSAVC